MRTVQRWKREEVTDVAGSEMVRHTVSKPSVTFNRSSCWDTRNLVQLDSRNKRVHRLTSSRTFPQQSRRWSTGGVNGMMQSDRDQCADTRVTTVRNAIGDPVRPKETPRPHHRHHLRLLGGPKATMKSSAGIVRGLPDHGSCHLRAVVGVRIATDSSSVIRRVVWTLDGPAVKSDKDVRRGSGSGHSTASSPSPSAW